jgi:hypothetical protein
MASSVMLRRVALVRTDVSEERSASSIRVTIIGVLVTASVVPISPPGGIRQIKIINSLPMLSPSYRGGGV